MPAKSKRKAAASTDDKTSSAAAASPAASAGNGCASDAATASTSTTNGDEKSSKQLKLSMHPPVTNTDRGFRFSIDRGGTFTDVYCEVPKYVGGKWDGKTFDYKVVKLLSVDPANYPDAPREAIRRVLEEVTGILHPKNAPLDSSRIEWIRMGTTVATNALLERKGERIAFVTTKGFRDLLRIGNQSRPRIFDLQIDRPELLYSAVVEVEERVRIAVDEQTAAANNNVAKGSTPLVTAAREELGLSPVHPTPLSAPISSDSKFGGVRSASSAAAASAVLKDHKVREVVGVTGERVRILQPLNVDDLRRQLTAIRATGIQSLAVSLMHSYTFREHEQTVGKIAAELGFTHISLSSSIMPMVKLVPRSFTACADAYLTPAIRRYVSQFVAGFDANFTRDVRVLFMQSDGGLVDMREFSGFRAILSGPAAGVVGYSRTTPRDGGKAVIAFDMGGTSTDVSRFDGHFEHVFENTTAGVTIQAPQLDINTVAAGGGSMLFFRSGMFVVGPESASAHPGPTCYRKGGPLTVTDANLFLGRLRPEHFPKIFGPDQNQPLDTEATKAAFVKLTGEINAYFAVQHKQKTAQRAELEAAERKKSGKRADSKKADAGAAATGPIVMTAEQVAFGFIEVANESMCRPIRAMTQARGYSLRDHVLACFGGAGGQHACALARSLGIEKIVVHRFSGILSAYGLHLADVVKEVQQPVAKVYSTAALTELNKSLDALAASASQALQSQGFSKDVIRIKRFLNLRYEGTDTAMFTTLDNERTDKKSGDAADGDDDMSDGAARDYVSKFVSKYKREYGFTLDRKILVDDIRVRAIATAKEAANGASATPKTAVEATPTASHIRSISGSAAAAKKLSAALASASGAVSAAALSNGGSTASPGAVNRHIAGDVPCRIENVYFGSSWQATRIYPLSALTEGDRVPGPAMLINNTSTIIVTPGCIAKIGAGGDVEITLGPKPATTTVSSAAAAAAAVAPPANSKSKKASAAVAVASSEDSEVDPIQLALFSHRFMSIAEQMGRTLQRTAISTNIKERLDFSCALFGPDGGLVANAPHLPVHLGAMQEAVRFQIGHIAAQGAGWRRGDVLVSNHPQAGGSHLPDITVITPVFADEASGSSGASSSGAAAGLPVFFVANRGHHSDIGGISPGSMPPFSKSLLHEGAAIVSFKLVQNGVFDEKGISSLLLAVPDQTITTESGIGTLADGEPKCSGTRNLRDNLSDLRAQVAANQKGITLVQELIQQYSLSVVQAYMGHIQHNAEMAVRDMLRDIAISQKATELKAVDYMDDGTPIVLKVTIDRDAGSAVFDFTGTGAQVYGNTNAPRAVTYSAIIYCLRCLVQREIPLNQGCLNPVKIIIPAGSLLNPGSTAAVVGGNVLTSQRVTDVVLRAFSAAAASQGCMNNLTFGDSHFGYYETIAGGAGAGPTWAGQSGVHTHMTNTRITDPEILERRYPVLLRQFILRTGSGGTGHYTGGEGVIRELEFLRSLSTGILSERRAFSPYGLKGGGDAARGINLVLTVDGRTLNIGRASTYHARTGDRIQINSPGGGGFGAPDASPLPSPSASPSSAALAIAPTHGSIAAYRETQEQA